MIIDFNGGGVHSLVISQLKFFFIDEQEETLIIENLETVLDRVEYCFSMNPNKYYSKIVDGKKLVYFNPYQSAQYCIFLYYLSNSISAINSLLADKIYYLNKMMNACDLYHQVELPAFFRLDHPIGSVMGRAKYGNGFSFGQNCTVGNNRGIYPVIGQNVRMAMSSAILGNSHIGDNSIIGAGAIVKDQNIPDNTIVFGQSPNLIIKNRK